MDLVVSHYNRLYFGLVLYFFFKLYIIFYKQGLIFFNKIEYGKPFAPGIYINKSAIVFLTKQYRTICARWHYLKYKC